MPQPTGDSASFRKVLDRTLILPLAVLTLLSAAFVGQVLYLKDLNQWVDHTDRVIAQLNHVQKLFLDSETGLRGFLLNGEDDFLEPYADSQSQLAAALAALRANVADNPAQQERIANLERRWDDWSALALSRLRARREGRPITIAESEQGKAKMDTIRGLVADALQTEETLRVRRSADADRFSWTALGLTTVLSLAAGSFMALGGRRQLVGLSRRYGEALAAQQSQNESLLRQGWISRGQAQLADATRGELSEEAMAERILAHVAHYLGVQMGVFYALDDAGEILERRATFAIGEPGPPRRIGLGESLAGQATKDGQVATLSDIPREYFKISSATGEIRPRHMVFAPFGADGRTLGVMELGFLGVPEPRMVEFLQASSIIVGSLLRSARYRGHLQELLAETQAQARELQTRQEELRVANEELQQQRDTLQSSQAQLESQQVELQATNAQLEEQTQALEAQRADLQQTQVALSEKASQLERANQYKSEFLANMSHELRTPLNSTLILAKLLSDNREGNLTADQVRYAQTISSAGNDLLALINDILDLSRIEAGRLELKVEPVPVQGVLAALTEIFQPVAVERRLAFRAQTLPGAPAQLTTDPQRLQQILKNLLSNAFKFTRQGEVALEVRATASGRIAFAVRDTGIGIPEDKQAVIFEAFRQADGSAHRQFGGTGLGLSISRDLAHRLGGEVLLESEPGKGSTFTLDVPQTLQALPPAPSQPSLAGAGGGASRDFGGLGRSYSNSVPGLTAAPEGSIDQVGAAPTGSPKATNEPPPAVWEGAGGRAGGGRALPPPPIDDDRARLTPGARTLLVIEDDLRFARIVQDLAHEQKFRCLVAASAAEGIDLARTHRPSAIVLDMNLPDASGLSVLEQLKRSGETRHIPVHVFSVADLSQQALQLGAVGYALKPVPTEKLVEALSALERRLEQKVRRVLVVEDAQAQRESLQALLKAEDVQVVAVATAQQALKQLKAATFDCLVLDLGLPDMTGYQLLEQMAGNPAVAFPPVIVYTGRELSADEELRLRKYSRSVVIKGARSPERLLDEVTLFLHRVESELPREQRRMVKEARSRESLFEGRRILLAEDDVRNIFALSSVLEPKGAQVLVARNGREALEQLERGPVDLVLMDIMMPEVDGLAATREIRRRPAHKKLPVIALTAKAMPDDREKCLEAGASDYIAKPIDVEKLLSLVRVWMPQ
ncbi:MAG: response regulator [Myxococcales bacterium]